MAGIDFEELERRITSYDKRDIRKSLEQLLALISKNDRIDAFALILCEDDEAQSHQINLTGNAGLMAKKFAMIMHDNPQFAELVSDEYAMLTEKNRTDNK